MSQDQLTSSRRTLQDPAQGHHSTRSWSSPLVCLERLLRALRGPYCPCAGSKAPGLPCWQPCEPAHFPHRYSAKAEHGSLCILSHRKRGDISNWPLPGLLHREGAMLTDLQLPPQNSGGEPWPQPLSLLHSLSPPVETMAHRLPLLGSLPSPPCSSNSA